MLSVAFRVLLSSVVAVQGLSLGTPAPAPNVADAVVYRFHNDRFVVSSVDLEIGPDGKGRLTFVRKGLAKPVERDVVVADAVLRQIKASLEKLRFLDSTDTYQSSSDHSNLGQVTIEVRQGSAHRETEFNYTTNKDMAAMQDLLRGIATREMYAFDLETATQFQPLDTPKLLGALKDEIDRDRVTDPAALLPLLRSLTDEISLPLIARNRASQLVAEIEAQRK